MIIEYSARSNVGMVRANNEDNLFVNGVILPSDKCESSFAIDGNTRSVALFAVCDGMGGEENGEIASQIAVQTLSEFSGLIATTASDTPDCLNEAVQSFVNEVNERIRSEIELSGKRMGTTLALAMISDNEICCFNMGDSRIYSLKRTMFRQITNDHTLAAERIRGGSRANGYVMENNTGNKLTRCIGIGDALTVERYPPIKGPCRMLICSDGLTDMVDSVEIENTMRVSSRVSDAADTFIKLSLINGGNDNVTVIAIDVKYSNMHVLGRYLKMLKR